jgi:hypothetical protein
VQDAGHGSSAHLSCMSDMPLFDTCTACRAGMTPHTQARTGQVSWAVGVQPCSLVALCLPEYHTTCSSVLQVVCTSHQVEATHTVPQCLQVGMACPTGMLNCFSLVLLLVAGTGMVRQPHAGSGKYLSSDLYVASSLQLAVCNSKAGRGPSLATPPSTSRCGERILTCLTAAAAPLWPQASTSGFLCCCLIIAALDSPHHAQVQKVNNGIPNFSIVLTGSQASGRHA